MASADDVVDALDQAARAKEVRAIVLRIDSPGGTYPAADAIADAVGRARSAGKPVIVSMGDVAASGGYLAAIRGDVIVAQPTTITASIGVFSIWPVASDLLASLGVKVDRLSIGTNAGMYSPFHAPTPAQSAAVSRELDTVYAEFTRQVGETRKLDGARLDAAARGRVLSGDDAKKAGLIDELGGLQLALNIAKAKAGIDESRQVEIHHFPAELGALAEGAGACPAAGRHGRERPEPARATRGARDAGPLRHRRRGPATSACRRCRRSGASSSRSLSSPGRRPRDL